MSIYTINSAPAVSQIIINEVRSHFVNDLSFADLFENFKNIRISSVHPFVHLLNVEVNSAREEQDLFPSITIVDDNDQKNPEIDTPTIIKDSIKITSAEVTDITNDRDRYIISDADLAAIDTLVEGANPVFASGIFQARRSSMVAEIWAENHTLKNRIYDLFRNFLLGPRRLTIKQSYDIIIDEKSVNGEKDGNYNFDFGRLIYGAIMRFSIDFEIAQFIIDSDTADFEGVIHTVEEIEHNE